MDLKFMFTTDEELQELEDRDMTTNIIGFVKSIAAPTAAGKNKELLLKFVLSNGTKCIDVLIWGSTLINKYYKEICYTRVVHINGGHCRAVAQTKLREENHYVPFEILIKENTSVTLLGYYGGEEEIITVQKADFDNIHTMEGLIDITGYVRTPFCATHTRNGLMIYGIGAITNGSKKITVHIKQFSDSESKLEVGDNITVQGTIKGQDSLVTIYCDSMNNIKFNSDAEQLPEEKIQRGGRPVKRIRTKEQ